jgi:DNA modification methylase
VPDDSVDMVLTSPPYFQLRDYGVAGQLGQEETVEGWVEGIRRISRELHRVLTPTGTLWLNLGDCYATGTGQGAPRKSLLMGPERLALGLIRDGWLLRNKIVWRKSNPLPTSARDRLACTWEAVYVFSKSTTYFFDLDAIRQPHTSAAAKRHRVTAAVRGREAWRGPNSGGTRGLQALKDAGLVGHPLGKNPGDVWTTASSNYRGGHRATFPIALVERAILAGCPEQRCARCRTPWRRSMIRAIGSSAVRGTLQPDCRCAGSAEPGLVLDPFIGSGTTAVVAEQWGRDWYGIELNRQYVEEAMLRINKATNGRAA